MTTDALLTAGFALTLAAYMLLGGVAWANRGKFPKRLQGGGSHATEEVDRPNECN